MRLLLIIPLLIGLHVFGAAPLKIPKVKPLTLKMTEVAELLTYPAQVDASIKASILAEADGVVNKLPHLGESVRKGQKILSIQQLDPVYQYAPVHISAPVAGVISEVFVSEGTRVSRGDKLAQVTDPKRLKINIEVPSSDISKIKTGMKGVFKNTQSSSSLEVSVSGLSPTVSTTTGTASALLTFVKPNVILNVGMIGQVQFKVKPEAQILVPEQAIIYKGSQPYLRVLENNIAKFREIALGARVAGQVVITTGVSPNEVVIERASQYVGDNNPVEIE